MAKKKKSKKTKQKKTKKKVKKNISRGVAHINSTFNNTMVTITDNQGNTISWAACGECGFKGSRKSTPYAAQMAAEKAGKSPKKFTDELIPKFKDAWKKLNVRYDRFIRTTDKDHHKIVEEISEKGNNKGDIYEGEYEGLYCVGCEKFLSERELEEGKCPLRISGY